MRKSTVAPVAWRSANLRSTDPKERRFDRMADEISLFPCVADLDELEFVIDAVQDLATES